MKGTGAAEAVQELAHPDVGDGCQQLFPKLLLFFHRTLSDEEMGPVAYHLKVCGKCRERLRRIDAVVSLFRETPVWRADCPTVLDIFHFSSFELTQDQTEKIQAHLPTCYACREELLVFKDVRQAARVGQAAFLNPRNWRMTRSYWKSRGYLNWFLQPRWKRRAIVAVKAIVPLLLIALTWQGILLELKRRPKDYQSVEGIPSWLLEAPLSSQSGYNGQSDDEVDIPDSRPSYYCFQYASNGSLNRLSQYASGLRWARLQVMEHSEGPPALRLGEPLGSEGMVVLRSIRRLSKEELETVEMTLEAALDGPPRSNARAWSKVRAQLQQLTNGEVWLLDEPPEPDASEVGRMSASKASIDG